MRKKRREAAKKPRSWNFPISQGERKKAWSGWRERATRESLKVTDQTKPHRQPLRGSHRPFCQREPPRAERARTNGSVGGEVIKMVKRGRKVLTVEPGPSRRQDLVQPLKSFFGGFLVFVTCPRLQSHLHVRGAAHLAAASHAAAYFQLLCWKNERKTRLKPAAQRVLSRRSPTRTSVILRRLHRSRYRG